MRPTKKKRKKTKVGLFVGTLLTTLGVFLGVFVVAAAGFSFLASSPYGDSDYISEGSTRARGGITENRPGGIINTLFNRPEPERSFALIMGVDDTRTDTMMVAAFDPVTSEINLVSLPRDSHVIMPPERVAQLRSMGAWAPQSGVMKLNEVHHFALLADRELAAPFLMMQVEELLGIELNYYVRVDLDAFKFLVDQIGGVHFNVPIRMFYHDPLQNLRIDLQPGPQLLDGYNALNMVRFRSYPAGDDFARMRTQQEFLRAFISQAMSVENIMSNIPAFFTVAMNYVDTNFGLTDIPNYLRFIGSFNADNINTYTLPHTHTAIIGGADFVILNEPAVRELVEDVLLGVAVVNEQTSEDLRIQILNGGNVSGLARSAQELLEMNGLTVAAIGDYQGVRADNNRIFVSRRGMGGDIRDILKNSNIIYDPSLNPRFDIVIVIGRLGLD
ncbi:MAG: LCP family protein [Defluviitaleaceae bacterium]|nr:LCP family protein [Defluviitaleaceae bacterium]